MNQLWPEFSYETFQPTLHLLHMGLQVVGKLKLNQPFDPHWANVALWLTSRGLTTGLIHQKTVSFTVDVDLMDQQVIMTNNWGNKTAFNIVPMSVAEFTAILLKNLQKINVDPTINLHPQEVPQPIPFNEDTQQRPYDANLVNTWRQILISTHRVLKRYHAKFNGITPPIGLMWGTLDLRDARYKGIKVPTTGENTGFIRRNAMDDAQVEVGFWAGNEMYKKPTFFAFTYPKPDHIEKAVIQPVAAKWNKALDEFVFDYEDLRQAKNPDEELLAFFESCYRAGAEHAKWARDLITSGEPV